MTRRRVYLAVARDQLRGLVTSGGLDPTGLPAFAVTEAVRAADPAHDEEDCEYDAFVLASRADPPGGAGARVVVISADLPTDRVRDAVSMSGYEVHVSGSVPVADLAAIHVADLDADPDDELNWYDVSELAEVVTQLDG